MGSPIEQDSERIVRRYHRRRLLLIFCIALVVALLTSWVWQWPAHAAEPTVQSGVAVAVALDQVIPPTLVSPESMRREGYVWMTHKPQGCYVWVAGWIQMSRPCGNHPLPGWFKRGVGSTVTGCLTGLAFSGGVVAGCVGGLLGSVSWD